MLFWNSLAFLTIQRMLAIWSLVPLPFLNPAWTSESSWLTYYWSLAWKILMITFLVCEMSAIVQQFEHSLGLPFFGIGMKTDFFQSCGHSWVFKIAGILSAVLSQHHLLRSEIAQLKFHHLHALFIVMFPKAHFTSHSRMPGSRWVIIPLWLSGSWRSFLCSSSVYSCHLFLISSASVRSI